MKYAGIFPVGKNGNKEYLLIGRELNGKWDIFGGGVDGNESFRQAAIREFSEESLTMVMPTKSVKKNLIHVVTSDNSTSLFLLPVDYDTNLIQHYNRVYTFITSCGKTRLEDFCSEKTELMWVLWLDVVKSAKNNKKYIQTHAKKLYTRKWFNTNVLSLMEWSKKKTI